MVRIALRKRVWKESWLEGVQGKLHACRSMRMLRSYRALIWSVVRMWPCSCVLFHESNCIRVSIGWKGGGEWPALVNSKTER